MSNWKDAYASREDLKEYGDNGLALFALALRFGVDDLETIAGEAITDGNDDKKLDMVYINHEEEYAVIAQCYYSSKDKQSAPSNKASDLNTGIGWLLQRDIKEVPDRIKSAAVEIRDAVREGAVKTIYIWYVHNLPQSENVTSELVTVQSTADTAIKRQFSSAKVNIHYVEVGDETLDTWYEESLSPILVNEELEVKTDGGYSISGPNWNAYSTAISAQFLYRQYKNHKTKIFSANIRDYLGSRSTDSNINNGIRRTIDSDPDDFWVFNNGLTILTHNFSVNDENIISFKGFSIVNGAQTTGAIGSLNKLPSPTAKVQARFVSTQDVDQELIHKIIQYNNSQNKVEASDFRSTDRFQKRLKTEFSHIPNAEYEGGRRGGAGDAIRRRPNLLPSYTVGQALACFHQDPIVAYNQKTAIWVSDRLYSKYFNENTKAAHIVCAYSLIRAVESRKKSLMDKSRKGSLQSHEEEFLKYFRQRGAIFLLSSAIVSCLEIILERKIPNLYRISFGGLVSPSQAEAYWEPIVDVTIPFCTQLNKALSGGLKNNTTVKEVVSTFRSLVQATSISNKGIYSTFSERISAP
ncbi:AIPR family protein [Oceanospirillum sediminis]|uniref:AIPR family protein n=1 Tax=Oceanospirillum sediminis TaxID=2760088 RepID=A0A839IMV2_9GAMM|nr:AIPR family protein [Oceanospirillum sediminis]MBB1485807.1 AIPR family protein [Oceanospirillum sediminis]